MRQFAKWLILAAMYFGLTNVYAEYIVSKPMDTLVQTAATVVVLLVTAGMLRYAVKDLLKLKNKFK